MTPRYSNPPGSPVRTARAADFIAFLARRGLSAFRPPKSPDGHVLSRSDALAQLKTPGDTITWLGHAAFYLRVDGVGLLIDPYLSRSAGPGLLGPPRFAGPTIGLADLPTLDALLLSHNHYDHFDAQTLRAMPHRETMAVLTPHGLGALTRSLGFRAITQLEWYETFRLDAVTIHAVPAIHWSRRGVIDDNTSHWCGYVIEWADRRIYLTGDTAYGPVFAEMANRWDGFDLGIIGIGAYEPVSIMKPFHTNPEEAIQIARDMRCDRALGMHWGTVILSDEDPWEPPVRFRAAAKEAGYSDDATWLMSIGETRSLDFTA